MALLVSRMSEACFLSMLWASLFLGEFRQCRHSSDFLCQVTGRTAAQNKPQIWFDLEGTVESGQPKVLALEAVFVLTICAVVGAVEPTLLCRNFPLNSDSSKNVRTNQILNLACSLTYER